jgi:hypothetical protein
MAGCREKQASQGIKTIYWTEIVEQKEVNLENLSFQRIKSRITNNSQYCSGLELDSKEQLYCYCQEGYIKTIMYDGVICIPEICSKIYGVFYSGDEHEGQYISNFLLCGQEIDLCDMISYDEGKDLCYTENVLRTGNNSNCKRIKNDDLKAKCDLI